MRRLAEPNRDNVGRHLRQAHGFDIAHTIETDGLKLMEEHENDHELEGTSHVHTSRHKREGTE